MTGSIIYEKYYGFIVYAFFFFTTPITVAPGHSDEKLDSSSKIMGRKAKKHHRCFGEKKKKT